MSVSRRIRLATEADVAALQEIERAADALFERVMGQEPFGEDSTTAGVDRMAEAGFVLMVAVGEDDDRAIGFAHVIEVDGSAHLEQLSVPAEHGRRGHGRALVEAAAEEASARGHERLTLRTYADVPWNRPFYESCGFAVSPPIDTPFHRGLVRAEAELGLLRHGRRVLMVRRLQSDSRTLPHR
jgi:GNAT superfamily N-acetyltransferase